MNGSLPVALILSVGLLYLSLPLLSVILSVLSFRRGVRAEPAEVRASASPPRLLFLIPAHDEELLIDSCVRSVTDLDYPSDAVGVVVVADNCEDGTPEMARRAGATVLERHDPSRRGKPWALAWALERVPLSEWDACIILDADSVVAPDFGRALAAAAPLRSKACQAYFGIRNEWESWLTRLAGLLTRMRYEVGYPLKRAAGLNCPLTGNGMCIGADLLAGRGWSSFSLTENWELYAEYTVAGIEIDYVPGARLLSEEAATPAQGRTQRRRWLAGRSRVFRIWTPRLLGSHVSFRQKIDGLAELGGASPVLHLVLATIAGVLSLWLLDGGLSVLLAVLALVSLAPEVVAVVVVLLRHPRPGSAMLAFLRLPGYALWRVLVAGGTLLGRGEREWRKTSRERSPGPR
ncbi:MAG: glycosyltransferase family 2 protein [Gemmatimonadota bacterium]